MSDTDIEAPSNEEGFVKMPVAPPTKWSLKKKLVVGGVIAVGIVGLIGVGCAIAYTFGAFEKAGTRKAGGNSRSVQSSVGDDGGDDTVDVGEVGADTSDSATETSTTTSGDVKSDSDTSLDNDIVDVEVVEVTLDEIQVISAGRSELDQNVPLIDGEYLTSPGNTAFAIQRANGALETYKGTMSDKKAQLQWTTGEQFTESGDGAFTMVQSDANICTTRGKPDQKGYTVWCSGSQHKDAAKEYGKLTLRLTDDAQLILMGSKSEVIRIWCSPLVASSIPAGRPMSNGNWIQSEDKQIFAIQQDDGRLEIYRGNNPRIRNPVLIWGSRDAGPKGDYFSKLAVTGQLQTWRGTPGAAKQELFWTSPAPVGQPMVGENAGLTLSLLDSGQLLSSNSAGFQFFISPLPSRSASARRE